MQASQLVYDIPVTSEYPNPSNRLRRFGFRINLSCWVIPTANVPWNLLHEMTDAGVSWHLLEFAANQSEKVLELARATIQKEIVEARKRLEEILSRADAKFISQLSAAEDGTALDKAENAYRNKIRYSLTAAEKLLKDLEHAAASFGLQAVVTPSCYQAIRSLKASADAKASAYARLTEAVAGTPLEAAARADDVPAGVIADYVEERGGDVSAERELLEAPTVTATVAAPPAPKVQPKTAESSFRLVSGSATVIFTPQGDHVRVVREWRGVVQSTKTVSRDLARKEYQRLLSQAYTRF